MSEVVKVMSFGFMICCSAIGLALQEPLMMIAAGIFAIAATNK